MRSIQVIRDSRTIGRVDFEEALDLIDRLLLRMEPVKQGQWLDESVETLLGHAVAHAGAYLYDEKEADLVSCATRALMALQQWCRQAG